MIKVSRFHMIKKLFLIIIAALSVVACSNTNSSSSFSSDNSVDAFNYDDAYKEINAFFNTQNSDFLIQLQSNSSSLPLLRVYSDDEKIMTSPYRCPDLLEITTRDKSILSGDGYKAYIEKDNSAIFINEYVDISRYIKRAVFFPISKTFRFTMNLKEAIARTNLFDSEVLQQLGDELYIDYENVDFLAEFNKDKVSTLSMVFDKYTDALYGTTIPLRIVYSISGYGDDFEKRKFSLDEYVKVNQETYSFVEKDFSYRVDYGEGYTFYSFMTSSQYYLHNLQDDTLVGRLCAPVSDDVIDIYFKDVVYDHERKSYIYSIAGKRYGFSVLVIDGKSIDRKDEIPFDGTDIVNDDNITFDADNSRLLYYRNGKLKVFNTSTLSVVKEFDIEGTLNKMLVHDEVYHITTLTETAPNSYSQTYCGLIYVIDKASLEVTDVINVNTSPYYTVIDKRGDIIFSRGDGSFGPAYIYHPATGIMEYLAGYEYICYPRCFIDYDEEKDMIIANDTIISSGIKPYLFVYSHDQYVLYERIELENGPSFSTVNLYYNGYFISSSNYLVNVKDWEHPTAELYVDTNLFYGMNFIMFLGNDNIYVVREDRDGSIFFVKIDTNTGDRYLYFTNERRNQYSFGFANGELIYLYNYMNASLVTFKLE